MKVSNTCVCARRNATRKAAHGDEVGVVQSRDDAAERLGLHLLERGQDHYQLGLGVGKTSEHRRCFAELARQLDHAGVVAALRERG
jgi:hypothetical protein